MSSPDQAHDVPLWLDRQAYPFAHHWIDLRAGRMHFVDEGQGDPMLFVHGTPTWSFEFRHLLKAFAPHARVVAPDHLGFGLSDRPGAFAYTPEAHADNLLEFVDRLDLHDITLVVHDFGGPIGLRVALERPERIARIVVLNSWMWSFDDDPVMTRRAKIAGGLVGRWLYEYANFSLRVLMPGAYGDRRRLTPAIHRQYLEVFRERRARVQVLHTLAASLLGSGRYFDSLRRRAAALAGTPMLIVWGVKDSAFRVDQLARWRALAPHADVATIDSAGHWPHEEAPDAVIAAIHRFRGAGATDVRSEHRDRAATSPSGGSALVAMASAAALPWYPKAIAGVLVLLVLALVGIRPFRRWIATADPRRLMAFHLVRFVGLYFFYLYSVGELPYDFAILGGAGDVVVATWAALLLARPPSRAMVLAWNVAGLVDILGVAATAFRSEIAAPGSMHQLDQLPLILLPTFIVPVIIFTHVAMLVRRGR